ncbi:unnamed protein product, partial [Polarella glacialis]
MDLNFGALNVTVMTLSVIVVLSMVVDGKSNWLQGYLLMAAYAVVAVLLGPLTNIDHSCMFYFVARGSVIGMQLIIWPRICRCTRFNRGKPNG